VAEIDPSYGVGWPYYSQTGSFYAPVSPPTLGPFEGTLVSLPCLNYDWLRLLLGASDQLRNPSTWKDLTPAQTVVVLSQVEELQAELSRAGACVICPQMRLEGCVLQFSCDAGATWIDVTGWAENFAGCVAAASPCPPITNVQFTAGCALQTSTDCGSSYSTVPGWVANFDSCVSGVLIPPVPPNPPGTPINQHACNIAGFIASEVMKVVIGKAVDSYNSDLTLLQFGTSIFNTVAFAFPLTAIAWDVFYAIYIEVTAATIADFTAAASDPVLWSALTCAIYDAIKTDGYITAGNLAALISNVCGMSYTYADVVTALCNFVTNIGLQNLQAMQNRGAVDDVDCSGCGGTWCWLEDLTATQSSWTNFYVGSHGTYTPGVGYVGTNFMGDLYVTVQAPFAPMHGCTSLEITFFRDQGDTRGASAFQLLHGGTSSYAFSLGGSSGPSPITVTVPMTGHVDVTKFIQLSITGTVGTLVLQSIKYCGTGPNPFGMDNCTCP